MTGELWTLNAEVIANFILVGQENIQSSIRPHPAIQTLQIVPELDEKNAQTGKFNIEIEFVVDTEEGKSPTSVPAYLGQDIFNLYINLLTFLTGHPVRIIKPPVLVHKYPKPNTFRTILFSVQEAHLEPPIPLKGPPLLSTGVGTKFMSILAWLRKGREEKNIVNSLLALFITLEMVSNQFKPGEQLTKICRKCGYKSKLDPSMRQRTEHYLVKEIGFTTSEFESIWKMRNRITHGGYELAAEELGELAEARNGLGVALIKGMKKLLQLKSTDPPREDSFGPWFSDPILDIDYTLPTKEEEKGA